MSRTPQELWMIFDALYSDIPREDNLYAQRPRLAHYTSVKVLEALAKTNEFWLGNPLLMNDVEEVRFGILEGTNALLWHPHIRDNLTPAQFSMYQQGYADARKRFDALVVLDTYVMCFSQHDVEDQDGLLSMWRGYGDSGKGVAIVLDTSILVEPTEPTPFIFSRVQYATTEKRREWFDRVARSFIKLVQEHHIEQDEVFVAAQALFSRLHIFSLFTKHEGFDEEREWRLVYLPDRDVNEEYSKYFSYHVGPKGVEPKLKVPISAFINDGNALTLKEFVSAIILGPNNTSPFAEASTQRMLKILKREQLSTKVVASRIPYRVS